MFYCLASGLSNLFLMSKSIELNDLSAQGSVQPDNSPNFSKNGTYYTFDIIDMHQVIKFIKSQLKKTGLHLAKFDEKRIFCDIIFISLLLGGICF